MKAYFLTTILFVSPTLLASAPLPDSLPDGRREQLQNSHAAAFNAQHGGWQGGEEKSLHPSSVEYALTAGMLGNEAELQRLHKTLTGAQALQDPEWNGFFQYAKRADWRQPRHQKTLATQAEVIRLYTQAYMATGRPEYLRTAKNTLDYANRFLRGDDPGYYHAQAATPPGDNIDAADYFALPDQARRDMGLPAVDKRQYSDNNAQMITALAWLYRATASRTYRDQAVAAGNWLRLHRKRWQGGFHHADKSEQDFYLRDNGAVLEAFIELYEITSDQFWLDRAKRLADDLRENLLAEQGAGLLRAAKSAEIDLQENIHLARTANRLAHYSGRNVDRQLALQAFGYIVQADLPSEDASEPGILLAAKEMNEAPLHLLVVGRKSDPRALALFEKALRVYPRYRRIEWWDSNRGKLPNHDIEVTPQDRPGLLVCGPQRCSAPVQRVSQVPATVKELKALLDIDTKD